MSTGVIQSISSFLGEESLNYVEGYLIPKEVLIAALVEVEKNFKSVCEEAFELNLTPRILMEGKLIKAERYIDEINNFGDPHTVSGVSQTASILLEKSFATIPAGYFLKTEAIITLLRKNPPLALLSHYKLADIQALCEQIKPEFILAITRHSESSEWQNKYQELLQEVTSDFFEKREIMTYAINTSFIKPLFKENKHQIKPWRLSHSKEVGVIILFTMEKGDESRTPHLLQTAVFLHYVEEILEASKFFEKTVSEILGVNIARLIANNRKPFPFLTDKNIYDETLYWNRALQRIINIWCPGDLTSFKHTNATAGFIDNKLISCNFVDILWNLNIQKTSGAYFRSPTDNYIYHFKQSLWLEIISQCSPLLPHHINELITKNLEKDNDTLTRLILKNQTAAEIDVLV